jgi:toxin ParE1/3/4
MHRIWLAKVKISNRAELDLIGIGRFTLRKWGLDQAISYINTLRDAVDCLVSPPEIGRKCDDLLKGYRRMEVASHVVFYKASPSKVYLVRILHKSLLPKEHL